MNLSPAETTLIQMLRDQPAITISITKNDEAVVVTMAMPVDGVNIGAGVSFDRAFFDLCGTEMPADVCGEAPTQTQN